MMTDELRLDRRQRLMLEEMGIDLSWWRKAEPQDAPSADAEAPPIVREDVAPLPRTAETPSPAPAPLQASPAAAAVRHPPAAPAAAVDRPAGAGSRVGAGVLVDAPTRLYASEGAPQGGWLIVADMPPGLDGRHGDAFDGDAGRLLDNMLRALGLQDAGVPVHLLRTHRGVASGQPDSPRPVVDALPECAAALAPRVVLAMGPLAAQCLLMSTEPLGKLRSRPAALALVPQMSEVPVIVTYHPAYLLRNPADKGRAWADLCLAAEQAKLEL